MALVTHLNSMRSPGVKAAAAELRLALHNVRELVERGCTSGEEWRQADIRQQEATRAWRFALREVSVTRSLLHPETAPSCAANRSTS
jgi:hypothetical protein